MSDVDNLAIEVLMEAVCGCTCMVGATRVVG